MSLRFIVPFLADSGGVDATAETDDDNPFQPILDFFDSGAFKATVRLFLFLLAALYLALIFWTFKDAKRRIADPILVAVAVATAIVFPFVGVIIYMILRPPEYLDDVRERELEIRAMERRLGHDQRCPYCRSEIEPSYLVCPVCTTRLKDPCRRCKSPLEPVWKICPYCTTPVRGPLPAELPGERSTIQ
jgi:Double zinc ribbon